MVYNKSEYTCNGHEITVQQVNEGGSVSAWIDGKAAYADEALEVWDAEGTHFERVKAVAEYMAEYDLYFCRKCNTFYDYQEANTYGFCDHKCQDCTDKDNTCQDGDDHSWKCTNPHQKNNARVSTKYKCEKCGKKRKTIATG